MSTTDHAPTYQRVYAVVRRIPPGKVASYGQIAAIVGNCTARMVGYALGGLAAEDDVPWQRVINAQGKISPRGPGLGALIQRDLLEEEGVEFNAAGKVDWRTVRWSGPEIGWLIENGFDPAGGWTERANFGQDERKGEG